MKRKKTPYEEFTYSVTSKKERIVIFILPCLALGAFVVVEAFGFVDNFLEKDIILMRLLLIFVLCSFVTPIVSIALEHTPGTGGLQFLIFMALDCVVCVLMVRVISTITAIIICGLWIHFISMVVRREIN
ncbi:hypothetical protein A2U01_0001742 [Trifolium medium]|uniref:Uncharacterized protein n=2 Tax=Trifolium medium TaxID=97028 RepID=A0A392M2X2_9FABA|nr:hypothetical protein [Trifolium medium]